MSIDPKLVQKVWLRIKISDKNCEWRFDESFIIFKFVKIKSQILVSSLYTEMCVKISLHVIENTTVGNVESDNEVLNSFALIESDWVFSSGFISWIKSIS